MFLELGSYAELTKIGLFCGVAQAVALAIMILAAFVAGFLGG